MYWWLFAASWRNVDDVSRCYTGMIRTFRHKGPQDFFLTGTKAGIQAIHANRLRMQLARLDAASMVDDMDLPNWRLHKLKGKLQGHWAVWVDPNWRLTFVFTDGEATLVDYLDYH